MFLSLFYFSFTPCLFLGGKVVHKEATFSVQLLITPHIRLPSCPEAAW